jgi:hypothetical protein
VWAVISILSERFSFIQFLPVNVLVSFMMFYFQGKSKPVLKRTEALDLNVTPFLK